MVAQLSLVGPLIEKKLLNMLGPEAAEQIASEILRELRMQRIETSNDRLRFGEALVTRGGLFSVMGHSIQTQALLHGAISSLNSVIGTRHS
jgi:hypothetical protein